MLAPQGSQTAYVVAERRNCPALERLRQRLAHAVLAAFYWPAYLRNIFDVMELELKDGCDLINRTWPRGL